LARIELRDREPMGFLDQSADPRVTVAASL